MIGCLDRLVRHARWAAFVGVVLVGGACKTNRDEGPAPAATPAESPRAAKARELAPKVKALLDKLADVAKKAKSEPPVQGDQPFKTKLEKGKFVVVGDKWLSDLHKRAEGDEIDLGNSTLSLCAYAHEAYANEKKEPKDDDIKYWGECLDVEYVAVLRVRKVTLPKVQLAAKTFTAGEVEGDMLLFSIASAAPQARYRFRTTNSDELRWFEGKPENEWRDESKRDLAENLKGVAEERLRQERDSMGR